LEFKDHFSKQAKEYSRYRPKYPPQLFEYLSSLAPSHDIAWDCATGNGQAAIGLTPWFSKIIATDASPSQIAHAEKHPKIEYRAATAENSMLESASADLVTVATAIHWLDTDRFYPEVKRILKPGGVIAVWLYDNCKISSDIDKISAKYTNEIVEEYWAVENKKAWNFNNSIEFPFEIINSPEFELTMYWDLEEYLNFLYTWSSTQNYIKTKGVNPIDIIRKEFESAWKNKKEKRTVNWKLKMKTGRI
jgi:ubiquinone/menaquinone biosynthesis C-methylase UbiE